MVDNMNRFLNVQSIPVSQLCDRRFGIGADGLIVLEPHDHLDFTMIYFNSDGSQSFCGNGSRCAVNFAKSLGIISGKTEFLSTDGDHNAEILTSGEVKLHMHDVSGISVSGNDLILNTGSPHYIRFEKDLSNLDVVGCARVVRYSDDFKKDGINVNFIKESGDTLNIRTYERGVEDETLSCGTGVTAAALAAHFASGKPVGNFSQKVQSMGGMLTVEFRFDGNHYDEIYLQGPAEFVFSGKIEI